MRTSWGPDLARAVVEYGCFQHSARPFTIPASDVVEVLDDGRTWRFRAIKCLACEEYVSVQGPDSHVVLIRFDVDVMPPPVTPEPRGPQDGW